MVPEVGIELILTGLSAVGGAWVLLWLQTKYERIKLLRGVEEEIESNIRMVATVGDSIKKDDAPEFLETITLSDATYEAIRIDAPFLYAKIADARFDIETTYTAIKQYEDRDFVKETWEENSKTSVLETLEETETMLLYAWQDVKEVQSENRMYSLYSSLFFEKGVEEEPPVFRSFITEQGEIIELNWRPSNQDPREKLEKRTKRRDSLERDSKSAT